MDNSKIKGIEQGRAKFAYDCAVEGKNILKNVEIDGNYYNDENYKSYVKKIPSLIKTNGLGACYAFVNSKKAKEKKKDGKTLKPGDKANPKNAYDLIYLQTAIWFKEHRSYLLPELNNDKDLVDEIIKLNSNQYRAVTNEILALFNWLRRFAEGLIEADETQND